MKALSLWQPYASLFAAGFKRIETRSWPTSYRGPLLVHAAKKWDRTLERICAEEPFRTFLEKLGVTNPSVDLPFGAIIGQVKIVACYSTDQIDCRSSAAVPKPIMDRDRLVIDGVERTFGNYGPKRFGYVCESFQLFDKPIPYRGQQSLFDVDVSILKENSHARVDAKSRRQDQSLFG